MNILFCIRDDKTGSPYKWTKRAQAFDVICAKPTGYVWGLQELNNPNWRIMEIPQLTEQLVAKYLAREATSLPPLEIPQQNTLQYRGVGVDFSQVNNAQLTAFLADNTRAVKVFLYTDALNKIRATVKQPVPPP